jgi:general stress protein 26
MKRDHLHDHRLKAELKAAGMTAYGFFKLETDYIPTVIHKNEHIKGVVYGRLEGRVDSVMLLATDKRIIFMDYKPFYQDSDEITYEVVSGIKMSVVGPFASVVLHTRIKDYSLRFVNIKCARIFVEYIENYIEQQGTNGNTANNDAEMPVQESEKQPSTYKPYKIDHSNVSNKTLQASSQFTFYTDTAVLSTISKEGEPHASVVSFVTDKDDNYYFVTKTETQKAKNILYKNNVVLTIHHSHSLKVLQVHGVAETELDNDTTKLLISAVTEPKTYKEGVKFPPLTKLDAGDYIVFKITPISIRVQDYSKSNW